MSSPGYLSFEVGKRFGKGLMALGGIGNEMHRQRSARHDDFCSYGAEPWGIEGQDELVDATDRAQRGEHLEQLGTGGRRLIRDGPGIGGRRLHACLCNGVGATSHSDSAVANRCRRGRHPADVGPRGSK
ncbi:MAG: hypothetical protein M0Z82_09795 [Actinomycetota bacterium]|nr:hypothetical protein [Actinomycetota bacterium]